MISENTREVKGDDLVEKFQRTNNFLPNGTYKIALQMQLILQWNDQYKWVENALNAKI